VSLTPGFNARAIALFDGNNEVELLHARAEWKEVKERRFAAAYWQQSENGRWEKKV
jgi:DNA polymerase-3 subunit chi